MHGVVGDPRCCPAVGDKLRDGWSCTAHLAFGLTSSPLGVCAHKKTASGSSLNVLSDSFAPRFELCSHRSSANSVRVTGRALLLGAYGGLYDAVLVGAGEVAAWRSAMRESHPGVVLVLLDGVVPEGGAACASEFTVWIAAGRRGLDQVYKPLRIYVEEPDPAPEPPPACGRSKRSLGAWLMTRLAGAR